MTYSGKYLVKFATTHGWEEKRTKGSHVILENKATKQKVTIPVHGDKPLKKGLAIKLAKILGV